MISSETILPWKMLGAIAKEDCVLQITSSAFLSKYGITSGPTALRNVKALIDKELVLATTEEDRGNGAIMIPLFFRSLLVSIGQMADISRPS